MLRKNEAAFPAQRRLVSGLDDRHPVHSRRTAAHAKRRRTSLWVPCENFKTAPTTGLHAEKNTELEWDLFLWFCSLSVAWSFGRLVSDLVGPVPWPIWSFSRFWSLKSPNSKNLGSRTCWTWTVQKEFGQRTEQPDVLPTFVLGRTWGRLTLAAAGSLPGKSHP